MNNNELTNKLESANNSTNKELENLTNSNTQLRQKIEELEQDLLNSVDNSEKSLPLGDVEEDEEELNEDKNEKDIEKPKSSKKILKYILIGVGVLFGLIVAWFAYASSVTPVANNTLSTNVQKVIPKAAPLKTVALQTETKTAYDFNKKLTEDEFKKQKFDIYKNNEFACRINGKKFVANDIINGWMFRKTIPTFGKLVFTDPAGTMSFGIDMESK